MEQIKNFILGWMGLVRVPGIIQVGGSHQTVTAPRNHENDTIVLLGGDEDGLRGKYFRNNNMCPPAWTYQLKRFFRDEFSDSACPWAGSVHKTGGRNNTGFVRTIIMIKNLDPLGGLINLCHLTIIKTMGPRSFGGKDIFQDQSGVINLSSQNRGSILSGPRISMRELFQGPPTVKTNGVWRYSGFPLKDRKATNLS